MLRRHELSSTTARLGSPPVTVLLTALTLALQGLTHCGGSTAGPAPQGTVDTASPPNDVTTDADIARSPDGSPPSSPDAGSPNTDTDEVRVNDEDGDGVEDAEDNCLTLANADQLDSGLRTLQRYIKEVSTDPSAIQALSRDGDEL